MRFLWCTAALVAAESVTPVQKVIQLLNGMLEKGKNEKHQEQVQFAAYKQFCEDTEDEKSRAIADANQRIEQLTAAIQKYQSEAKRLGQEIAEHEGDIAAWKGDEKAATKVRTIESNDFTATNQDYSESIDALGRAIGVLKKQTYDRKQGAEQLLQLKQKSLIPAKVKKQIDAFLQSAGPLDVVAPEANAYEFQSGGVIEMLEGLLDKFNDERTTLQKEEANSKHAYEMLMQDLAAQIATAEKQVSEKKTEKADNEHAAAEAKGDLADTTATRDDDSAYLDDLVATCKTKSSDFENRQQLRAEEIEAVEKAIEIMSADNVSGHADKYLPKLVQTSFMQIKSEAEAPLKSRALAFLDAQAKKIGSRLLSTLATNASADPFQKVRKMIQNLITRLMEEANQEASHKGWCDKELAVNEQTRKEKTEGVERLHAEVDELDASIAKLGKEIAKLTSEISEIAAAVAKATKNRSEEHETNEQTVKDAQEAQTAVASALTVLKDFYAKAGQATSLVQAPADAPEIFDAPYKGMQSENGGVVGMLEVIESDFARLESETKSAEETAQSNHDKFLSDSAVDKKQKETDVEHKTNKKQDQARSLIDAKDDLKSTQKELDNALETYDKLKPTCVNAGVSYEDRVKRREEEIESLQEALQILNGETI